MRMIGSFILISAQYSWSLADKPVFQSVQKGFFENGFIEINNPRASLII